MPVPQCMTLVSNPIRSGETSRPRTSVANLRATFAGAGAASHGSAGGGGGPPPPPREGGGEVRPSPPPPAVGSTVPAKPSSPPSRRPPRRARGGARSTLGLLEQDQSDPGLEEDQVTG